MGDRLRLVLRLTERDGLRLRLLGLLEYLLLFGLADRLSSGEGDRDRFLGILPLPRELDLRLEGSGDILRVLLGLRLRSLLHRGGGDLLPLFHRPLPLLYLLGGPPKRPLHGDLRLRGRQYLTVTTAPSIWPPSISRIASAASS